MSSMPNPLRDVRTARGTRLRVTVEHLHETPQHPDLPVRKSVYEMPVRRGDGAT